LAEFAGINSSEYGVENYFELLYLLGKSFLTPG
jgi:hypothetical protein